MNEQNPKPKFTITLTPASGSEWQIHFQGHEKAYQAPYTRVKDMVGPRRGIEYLGIDSYPLLAPHWYMGGKEFGNRVRDDGQAGNNCSVAYVPDGLPTFVDAVKQAGGALLLKLL